MVWNILTLPKRPGEPRTFAPAAFRTIKVKIKRDGGEKEKDDEFPDLWPPPQPCSPRQFWQLYRRLLRGALQFHLGQLERHTLPQALEGSEYPPTLSGS